MTDEEMAREETICMMVQDGWMTESEAIAIIDRAQMELFQKG